MYRRPKFLEVLLEIRQEMSREADYDVDFFAEMVRSGRQTKKKTSHSLLDPLAELAEPKNGKPRSPNRKS